MPLISFPSVSTFLCPSSHSGLAWMISSDRIFFSLFRPYSPCYAAGIELSPAAASSKSSFWKAVLLPSVSGTQMHIHMHTHTLWLNTWFWSYLVKCIYHHSTPWVYSAGAQYFAERFFNGFCASRILFPHLGSTLELVPNVLSMMVCSFYFHDSVSHSIT